MSFKVRLIPDDYHLHEVGVLGNGAGYWIDVQLNPENGSTRDFVTTYVFDVEGRMIWHLIEDMDLRSDPRQKSVKETIAAHKAKLGAAERSDIWISPFSVEAHGLTFGLVVRKPEEDDDPEYLNSLNEDGPLVDVMPGWTLMFHPPWDEGSYAT